MDKNNFLRDPDINQGMHVYLKVFVCYKWLNLRLFSVLSFSGTRLKIGWVNKLKRSSKFPALLMIIVTSFLAFQEESDR